MWPLLVGVIITLSIMRLFAAQIYDVMIVKMTERWYSAVIKVLEPSSRVLDMGIGTASALARNADAVRSKKLRFVGVDYEQTYIDRAQDVVRRAELKANVALHCSSVYDPVAQRAWRDELNDGQMFDAVYFSGSLSVMPDPPAALRAVASLLRPGGRVFVTQTFQKRFVPGLAQLKPLLKYLTTVDFGQLVYEHDLAHIIKAANMRVVHNGLIEGSIDTPLQTARMLILEPAGAGAGAGAGADTTQANKT